MPRVITLSGLGTVQPPFSRTGLVPEFVTPTPCQNPVLPTGKGCGGPIDCALKGTLKGIRLGGVRLGQADAVASPEWYMHPAVRVLSMVAAGASAWHGYKRNRSIGWAIVWGVAGALAPVITIPVALAQGFGKRG